MSTENYTYSLNTTKSAQEVFAHLINPKNWWMGIYNETIDGKSEAVGDVFSFRAGQGMHYTVQKLIELIPHQKIVWRVTHSELSFLDKTAEWKNTQIIFEIESNERQTKVTFTHKGLVPEIECYQNCSNGWTLYLQNLEKALQV